MLIIHLLLNLNDMIHSWALYSNASMSNLKWLCLHLQFSLLLLFISWILKQSCVSDNSAYYPGKNIQVFAFFSNFLTLVWFTFSLETGECSFFLSLLESFCYDEQFWASVFAADAYSFTSSNFNTIPFLPYKSLTWIKIWPTYKLLLLCSSRLFLLRNASGGYILLMSCLCWYR